jgi:tetratricopeptide (TPR) repeat protein
MPRVAISDRAIAGALALALGLAAAGGPAAAQPVVQPIPSAESRTLNAALARVASNPRDSGALVDAGNAALAMNDVEAAIGFFSRAEQVAPGDPRAKAGLAGAYVRNEDPFTAIRLFDEAERAGPLASPLLADRGLAYDLVGDNATAQRYYRQAGPANDEALRRLALSLAISGDKRGSEAALSPLMTRQDKSAWRTRAFSLAILGEEAQAVQIANATMPATLASGISPYLRYMRQLTRAQQAAAANLGHFPRASEIGRDDPRFAQYAPPSPRKPVTGADAGLIPTGEALGASGAKGRAAAAVHSPNRDERQARERQARLDREARDRQVREDRAAKDRQASLDRSRERERPPEPVVAVSTAAPPASTLAPSPLAAAPRPAPRPGPVVPPPGVPSLALATPAAAPTVPPVSPPAASPAKSPLVLGPSFSLTPGGSAAQAATPPPSATPAGKPAPPSARPGRLAAAFGDLAQPAVIAPSPGAVDIRRITPSRPSEAKPTKPATPAHPSRIWVQVATGRNKAALGFDWRRMTRDDAAVFRARKPYVTAWGQTNRLVIGPFETEAAANAFLTQLRRGNVDGAFLWTSPAGQIVDALAVAK